MKCPYDDKVICAFLEEITPKHITYHCDECPHYSPPHGNVRKVVKYAIVLTSIVFAFVYLLGEFFKCLFT